MPNFASSNPDNLRRDQTCLQTICKAAAFSHCQTPLSQVRIQPQSRLLSGRRKKALFVSPSPDTASKRAKGIYETPKKCRAEKAGEISRNLPFSRFFSSGSKLTCLHVSTGQFRCRICVSQFRCSAKKHFSLGETGACK